MRVPCFKSADFIRYWRRSGLKNPDKPKSYIKKNVRNHSYHRFYPDLAKIRINRGLLYLRAQAAKLVLLLLLFSINDSLMSCAVWR